ncbi:unnamed protein product [Coregonus sp. 'balchen']|nr:unnamed protein product [Coregonus sp. 'balchen']
MMESCGSLFSSLFWHPKDQTSYKQDAEVMMPEPGRGSDPRLAGLVPGNHNNREPPLPTPAPALTYSIVRENVTVASGSHVLHIDKITQSQSGRCRCTVTDHTGAQRHSREVQVTVEKVLLTPTLSVEPSGRQVYTEDTVTLACQLPGHSGLGWQFYWHKNRTQALWSSCGLVLEAVVEVGRSTECGVPLSHTQANTGAEQGEDSQSSTPNTARQSLLMSLRAGAFNLTCEVQLSDSKLSQHHGNHGLHSHPDPDRNRTTVVVTFSFLRDGWPVVRDSVSGLYSVARASSCHMGTYSCVVRAGRARRSSQEISITLDNLSLILYGSSEAEDKENCSAMSAVQYRDQNEREDSLVCTAGAFPEQAAQGRGTCSRPKHWLREGSGGWGGGARGWKDTQQFQEIDMCWI